MDGILRMEKEMQPTIFELFCDDLRAFLDWLSDDSRAVAACSTDIQQSVVSCVERHLGSEGVEKMNKEVE